MRWIETTGRSVAFWTMILVIPITGCGGRVANPVARMPEGSSGGGAAPYKEPRDPRGGEEAKTFAETNLTPAIGETLVSLVSDFDSVAVGSLVELRVEIDNATDVFSVPFHLVYDPDVLEYRAAREGSFLAKDGEATVFLAAPSTDGGRVVVGHSRMGPIDGVGGEGLLCVLTFVAVGTGDANLRFDRPEVVGAGREVRPAIFETFTLRVR